ncbi:MAG: glycosyltransferase family 1 protein [Rhodanobacteraceae bacterium]|nr:MAG: glycosyltransferase family 1 protein [Rhodanobacteraceae bacterium]
MKIGIDASRMRAGMTGAGRYAAGILNPLNNAMQDSTFVLYARRDCSIALPSKRWSVRCDRHPIWSQLPVTFWIHYRLGSLVTEDDLDVLWTPNTLIPRGAIGNLACVTSVLDFNHLLVPKTLPPITRFAHRRWMDTDVRRAELTVAISEGTSIRMQQYLGRRADAIAFPAVPEMPKVPVSDNADKILAALNVTEPFLLTVGTRAPRKNLQSAVKAIALVKSRGGLGSHQLVIAGPEAWNKRNRAIERVSGAHWIKPLGFVDDLSLAVLYSRADALVFPSLYEGFGMPVVEARAMGCRVITTDIPELREAGGDDTTYVEPTPEGIAAGLMDALSRPAPPVRILKHNWDDAADVMATMFRQVVTTA